MARKPPWRTVRGASRQRRAVRPERITPTHGTAPLNRSLPPVLALAGAFIAGISARHLGLPPVLLFALPAVPFLPWLRPEARRRSGLLVVVAVSGWLHGDAWSRHRDRDCRLGLREGAAYAVDGHVTGSWRRGFLLEVENGLPGGCRGTVYVAPVRGDGVPGPGTRVHGAGRWRAWPVAHDPERSGELALDAPVKRLEEGAGEGQERIGALAWQEVVATRVRRLFPRRSALVSALVLARKAELDPALREAFTRAGVAHLLAISGFHVGVLAVIVLGLLRGAGAGRRTAALAGAAVVWAYVLFIGAPDAAVRAGILLSLAGVGVLRGRPVHGAGALAGGLLIFAVIDPGAVTRVGFQLSFLGAGGLVLVGPLVDRGLIRHLGWTRAPALRSGVAVGIAATVATLPAVAWHFERVSAVGIPVTLLATPLVAVALPGLMASLVAEPLSGQAAAFLAGGADLLLVLLVRLVEAAAAPDLAAFQVPRSWLVAGSVGTGAALLAAPRRHVGPEVRLTLAVVGACSAVLLSPTVDRFAGTGSLEIALMDVGQGDAVAIRTPRGRWLLVDAGPGPPPRAVDPTPRVLTELRRRGIRRLELVLLSHPDMDHIGGAAAVMEALRPRLVAGPGHVRGTDAYVSALEAAARPGGGATRWLTLRADDRISMDGVELRVLHPPVTMDPDGDPNENSLVLILQFGDFTGFFGGDVGVAVEDVLVHEVGDVDLLKVSHHGSRTSTSRAFLAGVRPEVALLSVGRRNRYGHPHPAVIERLEAAVGEIHRTDRQGTVRLRVGRDGRWSLLGPVPGLPGWASKPD